MNGSAAVPEPKLRRPWPWWGRVGFRLAFLFWLLVCIPRGGIDFVFWWWPWLSRHLQQAVSWPLDTLTHLVGLHVFYLYGEAASPHATGSGDTALAWVGMLVVIVLATVGGAVWSAISEWRHRRREYQTLYAVLRLLLRFTLGMALLSYGFYNIFPLQMPPPSMELLRETYGASSPMRLLWTFMGVSASYRIFSGLTEALAGFLLLFRRTNTVGALSAAAVLLNVVMLNFSFDVPVKLYSSELLLMALFLLLPDVLPMARFFLARREAKLTGVWLPRMKRRSLRIATCVLQVLAIGCVLYNTAGSTWKLYHKQQTALNGYWVVDEAQGMPAQLHWHTIVVSSWYAIQAGPDDKLSWYMTKFLTKEHAVQMLGKQDGNSAPYADLHWFDEKDGHITLDGKWQGQPAVVKMHRVAPPSFPLTSRGFHWVQEYPYNR